MPARVLVVDDIATNVKLLGTKLASEYFEVLTAANGADALAICESGRCDIVLTDAMMPGMDGFELCRRLKAQPTTAHLPIVMVTALDQPSDRVRGLEAGADDFLTKPVDDTALFARVRSLMRLKSSLDELRVRIASTRGLGVEDPLLAASQEDGQNGRVLLVDDRPSSFERIAAALGPHQTVEIEADPQEALLRAADESFDVVLISLGLRNFDGLRLCGQLRSLERTRSVAVVLLAEADDRARTLRGLEIGAHDFLLRPIDRDELIARVRTQIRRKRYAERLRDGVQSSLELAVTDGLTGLHNRRYLDVQLRAMFDDAVRRDAPLCVLLLDIDRFKSINDGHGHAAGDLVLKEFADRVSGMTRAIDLVARYGGEEIVVAIPDAGLPEARAVAERIRDRIGRQPFSIGSDQSPLCVTVSIGVGCRIAGETDILGVMRRADAALYRAKDAGRNRVVAEAA